MLTLVCMRSTPGSVVKLRKTPIFLKKTQCCPSAIHWWIIANSQEHRINFFSSNPAFHPSLLPLPCWHGLTIVAHGCGMHALTGGDHNKTKHASVPYSRTSSSVQKTRSRTHHTAPPSHPPTPNPTSSEHTTQHPLPTHQHLTPQVLSPSPNRITSLR
jgi:hypothetical protein